jgi:hypothetical protein
MRFKSYPNVSQVVSGQPFQVRLPVPGPTIDRLLLLVGATAGPGLAAITNIRVMIDGNPIMEFATLADLDDLNRYHGRDAIAGAGTPASPYEACIYFRRPEISSFLGLKEVAAERVTSLRTRDIKNAWVEATITGAGAFCLAFGDEAPVSEAEPSGLITRIKRFPINAIAGDNEVLHDIPKGDGKTGLMQVHFQAADVTIVRSLKENGYAVIDGASKVALQEFQDQDGKVPVAGYTVIDFISNGNLDEVLMLSPTRELRGTIAKTAGAALPYYVEYLDRIGSGM